MSEKIMHMPSPGPEYWNWRCLQCSEPVADHASIWRIIWSWLGGHA